MSRKQNVFLIVLLFFITGFVQTGWGDEKFLIQKGDHFVAYYESRDDAGWAGKVLHQADRYYDKIARVIGYSRYQDFWSWEDRVKIIIYSTAEKYHKETGQPAWSKGGAVRDQYFLKARLIVTYRQDEDFLVSILPHEISHLMLRDFIGADKNIPIWFDEGIAQLQENGRLSLSLEAMKQLLKENNYIAFKDFLNLDVRPSNDEKLVQLFYIQSVTVVDFLMKKNGNAAFQELCYQMKNGLDFLTALKRVYSPSINSPDEFEKKWLRYMQNE